LGDREWLTVSIQLANVIREKLIALCGEIGKAQNAQAERADSIAA
jgi:hypothetical protein